MDPIMSSLVGIGIGVIASIIMLRGECPAEKWFRAFSVRFDRAVRQLDPERQLEVALRLVEDSGPLLVVARRTLERFAENEEESLAHKARASLQTLQHRRFTANPLPPAIMADMLARFSHRIDSLDDTIYRCSIDAAMDLLYDEDRDVRLVAREAFGPLGVFREHAA